MKKVLLFLISTPLFRKKIKLSQETVTKDNFQLFNQRELEVLNLPAAGYNDNEIAGLLHTNERIIYQCKSNILGKTNLPNISSTIQYAVDTHGQSPWNSALRVIRKKTAQNNLRLIFAGISFGA